MAKISFPTVKNGNTLSQINSNFASVAAELQNKVLYRDNPVGETNTVITDIDLNGQDILNGGTINADEIVVDGVNLTDQVNSAATSATNAANSASASAASAASAAQNVLDTQAIEDDVDAKLADIAMGPVISVNGVGGIVVIDKTTVGLSNVDNTSDVNKPISTATQTALDLKAPIASPTFTGTVSGITKSMVGLGNVDNTSDANKPVSTAQQAALDLKAPLASPSFTGVPVAPSAAVGTDTTQLATTAYVREEQRGPVFVAYRSTSDQSITDATATEVVFNTAEADSHSSFNTATGRFTPTRAGWYQINSTVRGVSTANDIVNAQIQLRKNGVNYKFGDVFLTSATAQLVSLTVSGLVFLNGSTDFVSIYLFVDTAAGTITIPAGQTDTWFDGVYIRP